MNLAVPRSLPPERNGRTNVLRCRLIPLVLLASCASPEAPLPGTAAALAPPPPPAPTRTAPSFSPADEQSAGPGPVAAGETVAVNDPSAPPDTPLCGRAAHERIAAAAAIAPDVADGAGACAATACFDPLTDTFIGADGYRHVCQ